MPVTQQILERVSASLPGFSSGTLRVTAAAARRDTDSEGNPRVRIVAVVDPPTGNQGWEVDDVLALQSRAEKLLRDEAPEAPWALVELRSNQDESSEQGEQNDDVGGALREAFEE